MSEQIIKTTPALKIPVRALCVSGGALPLRDQVATSEGRLLLEEKLAARKG